MSAEHNPKDDNYNLDLTIDEIKLLQSQLENSLSLTEIKRRLDALNWPNVCYAEVLNALGIK